MQSRKHTAGPWEIDTAPRSVVLYCCDFLLRTRRSLQYIHYPVIRPLPFQEIWIIRQYTQIIAIFFRFFYCSQPLPEILFSQRKYFYWVNEHPAKLKLSHNVSFSVEGVLLLCVKYDTISQLPVPLIGTINHWQRGMRCGGVIGAC